MTRTDGQAETLNPKFRCDKMKFKMGLELSFEGETLDGRGGAPGRRHTRPSSVHAGTDVVLISLSLSLLILIVGGRGGAYACRTPPPEAPEGGRAGAVEQRQAARAPCLQGFPQPALHPVAADHGRGTVCGLGFDPTPSKAMLLQVDKCSLICVRQHNSPSSSPDA